MSIALLARLTCDGCGATADVLAIGTTCLGYPEAPLPEGWTHDEGRRWDPRDEGRGYRPRRDLCPSCTARGKETR